MTTSQPRKQFAAHGYGDFAEMALKEVNMLRLVVNDLPAEGERGEPVVWDIRFDVASPGFLFTWAIVLERNVPSLLGYTLEDVKALAENNDFFLGCPKLALAILSVKADGGFGECPRWQCCIVGILVLMRVHCERSRTVRFVERVYELPQPFKGDRQVDMMLDAHAQVGGLCVNFRVTCNTRAHAHTQASTYTCNVYI